MCHGTRSRELGSSGCECWLVEMGVACMDDIDGRKGNSFHIEHFGTMQLNGIRLRELHELHQTFITEIVICGTVILIWLR